MAQTTGAMSAYDMYVGYSTNGTVWVDCGGSTSAVGVSGGERQTGNAHTFVGDTPLVKAGKRNPITVTYRGVYSEKATELYQVAKTAYEAGSAFYLRWSPGGGDAGDLGFTTGVGIVKNCVYPGGEGASGEPVLLEVQVEVAVVTQAAIGTAGW